MIKLAYDKAIAEIFSAKLSEPNQAGSFTSWDIDFRQISAGSGTTKISVRVGEKLTSLRIKLLSRVHQLGSAPPSLVTFGIPRPGGLSNWLRKESPESPLVCFGSGMEFDGVSNAGFEAVTVSITKSGLETIAGDFGLDFGEHALAPGALDLSASPGVARLLAQKYGTQSDAAFMETDREDEDEMTLALLMAISNARSLEDKSTARMRDRALRRALDLIEAEADDPPNIRELCVRCGASWPTLQRSFIETFGVGPKAYVTALRLNRVRQDLVTVGCTARIADIANRWGFWHMGQFAKDYRKMFGCLPSEDLSTGRAGLVGA